jgi:hypothetical protein
VLLAKENSTFSVRGKYSRTLFASVAALSLAGCSQPGADHTTAKAPAATAVASAPDAGTTARVRLMTGQQYANMIADVFGADIKPGTPFGPLRRTDGLLASGAASAGVTAGDLMKFQRAAAVVATQVVDNGNLEREIPSHRDSLVPCKPKSIEASDDVCAAKFIKSTGRLLFRQPLSNAKIAEFVGKAHTAADNNKDFYTGLAGVLEGMLVDPMVLMIADTTEADPKHKGQRRLDAYALASRLSFFLWNTVPDDAVLKAAESGEILTPKGRARVIDMMIASPRLENGVRAFFDDMFAFDDFDNLSKDSTVYPVVTGTALKEAREQTLRTITDHLITQHKDYRDLFTTRHTFMSPALAAVYQVPTKPGWTPYDFPADSPRAGILTQVSFLAVHSHPARSSATLRGKALRELLLCQKVPPPPPNVDFSAVEDPKSPFKTARERVGFHLKNPVCAGCHKITDPMGLALENFDGGGQYRDNEKGTPIDASGSLDGKTFKDLAGLGVALRDHPSLPSCLVKRVYSYGSGGPLSPADDDQIAALNKTFAAAGYRVPELLRAIAASDTFIRIIEKPAPQAPAKSASVPASTAPAAQ